MRLSQNQLLRIAHYVVKQVHESMAIEPKVDDDLIKKTTVDILKKNLEEEAALEREVEAMLNQLEQQNPGAFERYKMYPLLKKKLAEQKGFVL